MKYSLLRKMLLVLTAFCFFGSLLFSQKTEFKANAYGGIFSFHGNGSTGASIGYLHPYGFYGRKPGFSYAFELQSQRVTQQKNLFGLGVSFEKTVSKKNTTIFVTDIIGSEIPGPPEVGETTLTNTFATLNPFIGHRFFGKALTLDLLAGVDLAFSAKRVVVIETYNSKRNDFYKFEKNEITPTVDIRPRIQLSANYKHFSLLVACSLGMTNYQTKVDAKAYSGFLRAGIGYRLK